MTYTGDESAADNCVKVPKLGSAVSPPSLLLSSL